MKNNDGSHQFYRAGIDRIDNHIPENTVSPMLNACLVYNRL